MMTEDNVETLSIAEAGWRHAKTLPSLPEAHRTIPIAANASWLRKICAFSGPGYLIAVGYMDPGNWATGISAGSKFGYSLLCVILLSNLFAMFLQTLSAKLGIATGRDLAQACRDHYPPQLSFFLWIVCEIAIAACDLAEISGVSCSTQTVIWISPFSRCISYDLRCVFNIGNAKFWLSFN